MQISGECSNIKLLHNDQGFRIFTSRIFTSRNNTQYFASVFFDLIQTGYNHEEESFISRWMEKILIPQKDVFQNIYDQLTNSQRATLQAIADLNEDGIFSEAAKVRYDLPVSSSLNEVIKALQKKGLIYKSEQGYRITNPVFKEWLLGLW